jgi:uncharacterized RDD family membrane protein YckC
METNPYAAPGAVVEDAHAFSGNDLEARKAGRGTRLGAFLLDYLILCLCTAPFLFSAFRTYAAKVHGQPYAPPAFGALLPIFGLLCLALAIANIVLLVQNGQTLGKRIVNIKIVRSDGSRCGFARIFFLRMLPIGLLGLIPFIGRFAWLVDSLLIFGSERRCLHDLTADTIVVND